jgi:hypothetical protein
MANDVEITLQNEAGRPHEKAHQPSRSGRAIFS